MGEENPIIGYVSITHKVKEASELYQQLHQMDRIKEVYLLAAGTGSLAYVKGEKNPSMEESEIREKLESVGRDIETLDGVVDVKALLGKRENPSVTLSK